MTQTELISEWHSAISYQASHKDLTKDFYALMNIMKKELIKGGIIHMPELGTLKSIFKDSQSYKIKNKHGEFLSGITPKKYKIVFRESKALKENLEIK